MTWLLMYSVTRLYIPCQKSNLSRTQIRTSVIWWSRDFDFGDSKLAKVVFVITWKLKLDIIWIWNSLGSLKFLIQGDPNQNLLFQMAITLKIRISDPMLVKPKCVLAASIYFHFSAVCLQFSKINGGLRIYFDITNMGQKCISTEL